MLRPDNRVFIAFLPGDTAQHNMHLIVPSLLFRFPLTYRRYSIVDINEILRHGNLQYICIIPYGVVILPVGLLTVPPEGQRLYHAAAPAAVLIKVYTGLVNLVHYIIVPVGLLIISQETDAGIEPPPQAGIFPKHPVLRHKFGKKLPFAQSKSLPHEPVLFLLITAG